MSESIRGIVNCHYIVLFLLPNNNVTIMRIALHKYIIQYNNSASFSLGESSARGDLGLQNVCFSIFNALPFF